MLPLLLLSVICHASLAADQPVDNCPGSIARDEFLKVHNTSCYQFVLSYTLDWPTAKSHCTNHGGTIVLVKSKDVSDFLIDQLTFEYSNTNKIWIGLSDRDVEGTFQWEDGSPLGDYTNWGPHSGPGHNTSSSILQDCITFDPNKNGIWEEDVCTGFLGLLSHDRPFVCQYRLRGAPAPPA